MTLEERLLRRLKNWRAAAKLHREAMDELFEHDDEWWMHKVEAEAFERCVSELTADLAASAPPATALRTASSV